MPYEQFYLSLLIGTAIALLGFFRPPRHVIDLVRPRFAIPFAFWCALFAASLVGRNPDGNIPFSRYIAENGLNAAWYGIMCLGCFWIGYILPVSSRITAQIAIVGNHTLPSEHLARKLSFLIGMFTSIIFFLAYGFSIFSNSIQWFSSGREPNVILSFLVSKPNLLANFFGAILLGVGWPENRQERTPARMVVCIFTILLLGFQPMAWFSRGAGLMLPLAVFGYIIKTGRVPVKSVCISVIWALVCANAALYGRGVYGHDGGILLFAKSVFESIDHWSDLDATTRIITGAIDVMQPLCVAMKAVQVGTDIHAMSPIDWLLFQLPIPSFLPILPTYTVDLTLFLGGAGNWGFTSSIFGDTYIHFGFMGCIAFVYIGYVSKFIDRILITAEHNTLLLLLPIYYYGILNGFFNNFRAFQSSWIYPSILLFLLCAIVRRFNESNRNLLLSTSDYT